MLLWGGPQSSAQPVCYLSILSRYPFVLQGREEQVRVKCLAQGHNKRPTQGSNSQPWDYAHTGFELTTLGSLQSRSSTTELRMPTHNQEENIVNENPCKNKSSDAPWWWDLA